MTDLKARSRANETTRRTMAILNLLASRSAMTLTEISAALSMPRTTVLGILQALVQGGFVFRSGPREPFSVGTGLVRLGLEALGHTDLRTILRPAMQSIVDEFGDTCNLGVWSPDRLSILYIEKVDGVKSIRIAAWVGKTNPCHCTALGKAMLSTLTEMEMNNWVSKAEPFQRFTRRTIVDRERLLQHLRNVAVTHYAVDEQEHELGVCCVAIPICDRTGTAQAAVSLSAPATRLGPDRWFTVANRMATVVQDALTSNVSGHVNYVMTPRPSASRGE